MQRTLTTLALTCALGALGTSGAAAQDAPRRLSIGDPAPPLAVGKWIKGEPVKALGQGAVTVVDFWATWCGPCIATIPHMSETQAKYADQKVNIIGVSVWENRPSAVVPFVETRDRNETKGDEMAYRVAADDVPPLPPGVQEGTREAGAHAAKGEMARTWMEAAGRNGIPTVFVVDREGLIAWIGHPLDGMDEALAQVVAGTWDMEQAKSAAREAERIAQIEDELLGRLQSGDVAGAVALAREHVSTTLKDSPGTLNLIAWVVVDPEGGYEVQDGDLELALKAAARANELTDGEAPAILDTLARVHFRLGNLDQAVALQRAAVEKSEGNQRQSMQQSLDEYEAAARKGDTAA